MLFDMRFLTLEQIKKHLYIDSDFTEDDGYLLQLADVAEITLEKHIDCDIDDVLETIIVTDEDGTEQEEKKLPAPLIQAMLLFIGTMYGNRESVSYATAKEVPYSYKYLLDLYQNYY